MLCSRNKYLLDAPDEDEDRIEKDLRHNLLFSELLKDNQVQRLWDNLGKERRKEFWAHLEDQDQEMQRQLFGWDDDQESLRQRNRELSPLRPIK